MFDRENAVGFLLLGLCTAVGGVLVYAIVTGERFRFTGPGWLGVLLLVVFVGASLYGLFGPGRRWPDPFTGLLRRRWPWKRRQDDKG